MFNLILPSYDTVRSYFPKYILTDEPLESMIDYISEQKREMIGIIQIDATDIKPGLV
jgi:hypothetical protein